MAHRIVLSALDGINGTVFAYGQTGSGKTFTMTGGAQRYVDRGIIPRSIGLIYSELGKRSDCSYTVSSISSYQMNEFLDFLHNAIIAAVLSLTPGLVFAHANDHLRIKLKLILLPICDHGLSSK